MEKEVQDILRMELSLSGSARPLLELLQSARASIPLLSTEVRGGWSGKTGKAQNSLAWQQASQGPTRDKPHLPQKLQTDLVHIHCVMSSVTTLPRFQIGESSRTLISTVAGGNQKTKHTEPGTEQVFCSCRMMGFLVSL